MNSFIIIVVIVIVLFACVGLITFVQRREHAKSELRQKIAKLRYRSNQASEILSNLANLPIGVDTRKILLQYALANLNAINKLTPNDSVNNSNIETLRTLLNNPNSPTDNQPLVIPGDLVVLRKQINALTNLAKYILRLHKLNNVTAALVNPSINRIMALIAESKICAFIQQGKNSLQDQEIVKAHHEFSTAQQMLDKVNDKNERLANLQTELLALIGGVNIATNNLHQTTFDSQSTDNSDRLNEENAKNDQADTSSDLFGPRKKW